METGDKNKYEKEVGNISSSEDSSSETSDRGKDEGGLSSAMEALNVNESNENFFGEDEQEGSDHKVHESSDSDVETSKTRKRVEKILSEEEERGLGFENIAIVSQTKENIPIEEKEIGVVSRDAFKVSQTISDAEKGSDSDSESTRNGMQSTEQVREKDSDSDSENAKTTSKATEEIHVVEKGNDSDSESTRKGMQSGSDSDSENTRKGMQSTEQVPVMEKESDSDSENAKKRSKATEEVHVIEKGSDSDSEDANRMMQSTEEVPLIETGGDLDSENANKVNKATETAYVIESASDSDSENAKRRMKSTEEVHVIEKGSDSDSENPNKVNKATETANVIEWVSDSDSENASIMMQSIEEVDIIEKGSDSDSENANKVNKATETSHVIESGCDSDSENARRMMQSTKQVNVIEKGSDSDSENANKVNKATETAPVIESGSDSDSENASRMMQSTEEVHVIEKGSDSDSTNANKVNKATETAPVIESGSDSDSENAKRMMQSTEEVHVIENGSDSDSENANKVNKATETANVNKVNKATETANVIEWVSDSDSENASRMMQSTEEVPVIERGGGPDSGNANNMSQSIDKVPVIEKGSDSDSETENKMAGSVSDFENANKMMQSIDKVPTTERGSDSDSENENKMMQSTKKVPIIERGSDSDSENENKMMQFTNKVPVIERESESGSENENKMVQSTEKVPTIERESDSDSENADKLIQYTKEIHTVDKGSDSDSENSKIQSREEVTVIEKGSDSDSENANKMNEDTDDVFAEEKEADPVFDGTEAPEQEAARVSSDRSLDLRKDAQSSAWSEKAVALKNFVKVKGAVAASTVIRRLSGAKGDDGLPHGDEGSTKDINQEDDLSMKGRIIVYTRLGCHECKEVRSFMHRKRLKCVEINIDVYPGRKLEMEKNTGSSAVPRVYFNDFLVGGLKELKAMDELGKLDEKIKTLIDEKPAPAAPSPPFPGEDDVSGTGKVDELATIVNKMKESVVLRDRYYKLRKFSNCFLGSEAVDFLAQDQYLERAEAVEFGRNLVKKLFFQHVLGENVFEDGNQLYRFLEHDPVVLSQCYNIPKGLLEFKPKPIVEIASRLRFLSFAIFEAYLSEDGRHVDYRSIHTSEEFQRYLRTIEELHRVEMGRMSREEKLAFFINLHNMMAIHAILTCGYPVGALERRKFLGDFKYVVGGCTYSLSAIQNGILRGNQRPPYSINKPFAPKDKRFKVALAYPEPLVHFALVSGTRSGPALRCYSPGNIDKELMEAARNFLRNGEFIVDTEAKVASVSKILQWYSVDFGKDELEVLRHGANYLEPEKTEEVLELLATTQVKVTYQPYDWGLNC